MCAKRRCHVHRCVKHKQPVEFGDLLVGNRREQSVRRTPASASATGYCRPFDDTAGRQNDRGCAERRDNRGGDGLSAIGAPGGLSRSFRQIRFSHCSVRTDGMANNTLTLRVKLRARTNRI